jgi:hypothetical protein
MKKGDKVFLISTKKHIGYIIDKNDRLVVFESLNGERRVFNPEYQYVDSATEKESIFKQIINIFRGK